MQQSEYVKIQQALTDHLNNVIMYKNLNRREAGIYEKAVLACKSIVSSNCTKEWKNDD